MKVFSICAYILAATVGFSVFAAGGVDVNGGDACENRFKIVRDDLQNWIGAGGSKGLIFPNGISLDQYNRAMLDKISRATIACVGTPVFVGSVEKTCVNYIEPGGAPTMVCNAKRFLETPEEDQYVLVHHEYAGLSGLEVNTGDGSVYVISNQITEYLQDQIVKKLVVKPQVPDPGPKLKTCDMDSMQPILVKRIIEALYGLYLINGEVLDKSRVQILRAANIKMDTFTYPALDIKFTSPRGTPMSFKSVSYRLFFPALAFDFRVLEKRDADGFLIEKTCGPSRGIGYATIINEVNNLEAPITDKLDYSIPGMDISPISLIDDPVSMELVEP